MSHLKGNPVAATRVQRIDCAIKKHCLVRLSVSNNMVTAMFINEKNKCCMAQCDPLALGPLIDYLVGHDRPQSYKPTERSETGSFLWCRWAKGVFRISPSWNRTLNHEIGLSEGDLARVIKFLKNSLEAARQKQREARRLDQPAFGLT